MAKDALPDGRTAADRLRQHIGFPATASPMPGTPEVTVSRQLSDGQEEKRERNELTATTRVASGA